jgi:hypothetical protein
VKAADFADQLHRALSSMEASVRTVDDNLVEVAAQSAQRERRIEVYVRDDCDFDVAFHIPERAGSPFEQVFVGPPNAAADVQETVVRLVVDLVAERLVLAMAPGWWRGGRQFLAPSTLSWATAKRLRWVASWRGTYDSEESEA